MHKSTEKETGLSISGFDHVTRGLLISMTVVIAVFVSVKVAVYTYSMSTNHEKLNVSSGGHYELYSFKRREEVC